MRAVQISSYGKNDVVQLVEFGIPVPNADEVLIKVETAGVNAIDWKIRSGAGERLGLKLPILLGGEIAGVIEKLGDAVTSFKEGDRVFGMVKAGGFADYVSAKASDIALIPQGLDFVQAAAIPLCGLTAWQAMFDIAGLREGQSILVVGASGAVGSLAVQLAKVKGAQVTGMASDKNKDFVESLGVSQFIDYEKEKFEDIGKRFDVVFDTVGGETFKKSFQFVKKGGFLVTAVAFPNPEETAILDFKTGRVFCQADSQKLKQIGKLCEAGKLKARVSTVMPLAEVRNALELSESGRANGKIVLQIGSSL
jgi:NADPH:quinone reductase-like Zn-dependent oxidoreductase